MVLEQMLHAVPKMMARRKMIISLRPHLLMLDDRLLLFDILSETGAMGEE